MEINLNNDYNNWIIDLKSIIKQSQIKASILVNKELISLYWNIGKQINILLCNSKYGDKVIDKISIDLKNEFPNIKGFSRSNLFVMKKFFEFYNSSEIVQQLAGQFENTKVQQPVGLSKEFDKSILFNIPWGHHTLIIQKIKNINEAIFYIQQTIENNWSRSILEYQIETNLYKRQGKSINNFKNTLPEYESDLAQQLLKDPYNFEFLTLTAKAKESELEQKLTQNITEFLLELGKGFAYLGKQFTLKIGNKEYRTDLLFYHIHLRAYIIIELKMIEFQPEFIGKLNFYISAINELIKTPADNNTIGILLCKNKDDYEVEFALKDVNKPIGVSEFKYKELPTEIKNALPNIEDLKNTLNEIK